MHKNNDISHLINYLNQFNKVDTDAVKINDKEIKLSLSNGESFKLTKYEWKRVQKGVPRLNKVLKNENK